MPNIKDKQHYEKRTSLRHSASPALTCQVSLSGKKSNVRGLNHSDSGISFENGTEIKPDSIVYVWRDQCAPDCSPGENCIGCRSVTLATIRWCRKIKTRETEFYRIGAKYFEF